MCVCENGGGGDLYDQVTRSRDSLPWHSGSCDRAFKSGGRITEINSPESFVSSSLLQWEGEEKKPEQSEVEQDGCLLNPLVHVR